MHKLGKNIKFLRKQLNKTQSDIASLVSKGHTTIGNWESGESEPNLKELMTIAKYFGASIDDLLYKDIENQVSGPNEEAALWQAVKELRKDLTELQKSVNQIKK